ncbi:hypothetical protein SAMN05444583_12059 [Rhodococcus maanshanensis]|uniref:Uncharacterized protein n=1 Tax=Rhodococcus maanshanensis TaxID=183556 RepID=A0A1H7V3V5_9NOCA|nr:hypothetical protein SAMN05444583_12059 [Rhodococcus maanshanensis]
MRTHGRTLRGATRGWSLRVAAALPSYPGRSCADRGNQTGGRYIASTSSPSGRSPLPSSILARHALRTRTVPASVEHADHRLDLPTRVSMPLWRQPLRELVRFSERSQPSASSFMTPGGTWTTGSATDSPSASYTEGGRTVRRRMCRVTETKASRFSGETSFSSHSAAVVRCDSIWAARSVPVSVRDTKCARRSVGSGCLSISPFCPSTSSTAATCWALQPIASLI